MTLDTRVYVLDRINHKDAFVRCNQLIGATEATRFTDEQDKTWRNGEGKPEPGNAWTISNTPGQGLCAWLMVHYRPGAPLRTQEQADAHDDGWCDEDCTGEHHDRACWLEISFDTAYGYRDEQGRGCGDLHASLVSQLGQWLDERGVRWLWMNEFSGEVHSGYDRLIDLCSGGFEAAAWFQHTVLPAIQNEIANGGAS